MAKSAEQIIKEALGIVRNAQEVMGASAAFYRSHGLDPEKVESVLAARLGPREQAEAEAQFRQDMADVEREATEEAARMRFTADRSSGAGRMPRPMV